MVQKTGFGGGCHWCTEAIFLSLKGVRSVKQGWIMSEAENNYFSEGVIVEYDPQLLNLDILTAIHIYTHSATSNHAMRNKYRSAVYYFDDEQVAAIKYALQKIQEEFKQPLVTQVLRFVEFKENIDEQLNYYYSDPERPFCKTYIDPKLKLLLQKFSNVLDTGKISHIIDPK